MKKIILIDGNSLVNRAFYATPPLTDKKGMPTNAVFAFVNMLGKMLTDLKPEYMAVAFDLKAPTFRHEMFADYKGTRKPMPDDLVCQMPVVKEVLATMGVKMVELAGYEADDIIGTLAKKFQVQTYIITGDKDAFQLVDENTSVWFTKRGITDLEEYNYENFKEKTGIEPWQVVELKALMGDTSDNIPGVRGIGEKTAKALIEKYGSVENIYRSADSAADGVRLVEKLRDGRESAALSRTLATIDTHVPLDVELEQMTYTFPFPGATRQKLLEIDFRSLMRKADWFDGEAEPLPVHDEIPPAEKTVIKTADDFRAVLASKKFALFIGRTVNVYTDREYELSIKETLLDDGVTLDDALAELKPALEDPEVELTVFQSKDLAHYLRKNGIELRTKIEDVSIMKYIADFSGREEGFDEMVLEYRLPKETPAYCLVYAREMLAEMMKKEDLEHLYRDLELPLAKVLFDMEIEGFKVDVDMMRAMGRGYQSRINEICERIFELAGERFNLNSTKQLGAILFDKLGLSSGKKTKRGLSTSAEVLEYLCDKHEIIPLILKFRQLQKLQSTYIEGFMPLIDRGTGLVHTKFNQLVTATGRLSSKEPNLQNIPVRDEEGREIRKFFIPRDADHILVDADYSQIELRLLAHFSGSRELIDAYNEGRDIHALTASQVFGVPIGEVTDEMRRSAKAVNFGIIYGISDFGLGKNLKISSRRAGEYIRRYFETYPGVKNYMDGNVAHAKKYGYVKTLLGRKRMIPELRSSNYNIRSFGERAAMNMPLQGTSADIIKIAMIRVARRLKAENLQSKLILQVHDELIVDALRSEQAQVMVILKEEMEHAASLQVPLTAEVSSGENWYEAH